MFHNWTWSGSQWIATPTTGLRVLSQTFTASGNYMPSPGLISLTVECMGGGGAGGSVFLATALAAGGGGGGAGGYSRKTLPAALVRGGVPVTVGAGGGPPPAGAIWQGGTTSFGALCVANGGYSAQDNTASGGNWGVGGEGGPAGIGDVAVQGNGGQGGSLVQADVAPGAMFGGQGAPGYFGGAPRQTEIGSGANANGAQAADNTGAGGCGGVSNVGPTQVVVPGGDGGSGICIVTEYCWGDRDDVNQWSPPVNVNLNVRNQPGWLPPPGPWPPGTLPPGPWPRAEDDP